MSNDYCDAVYETTFSKRKSIHYVIGHMPKALVKAGALITIVGKNYFAMEFFIN